ncbi:MAG TPA: hypothetical protein PLD47_07010 [Aggregatilineales bacterium]|nr:hypothetical protein [Anaerolineales bacterium]HRE47458.1 hypothetical protein [Aggregatilineales bacterium]
MTFLVGVLLVALGAGVLGFGIYLYYAFLPLFYGFLGAGIGFWLSQALGISSDILAAIVIIAVAVGFAAAAQYLEPYRRILVGVSVGMGIALSVGTALGVSQFVLLIFAIAGGVGGAMVVASLYNELVIAASAMTGAAMIIDGLFLILGLNGMFFYRYNLLGRGAFLTLILWIALTVGGIYWQLNNVTKMVPAEKRKMV